MPRSKPYRLLTLGVISAFGASLVGAFLNAGAGKQEAAAPPALLPAAYANPAEVGFADTLHAGETLSQLLLRVELAEEEAGALLSELREHQDPRRLHPGFVVSYRKSFVDGEVRGMELRLDADRTLSLHRESGRWTSSVEEVPVRTDTVVLAGAVQTSLYAALLNQQGRGVPADELERIADLLADRIFAWQVDFSRDLREGDRFRVLYERMVRPDGTARSGRVLGVQFKINERDFEAYAFALPDGSEDYYDRDGESLRRAFLRAPLQFRRISSAFSTSRFHPVLKRNRPHHGIDYAAGSGTPIFAVGDGVIGKAGWGGGYGNVVEIKHSRGYSTRYAHLKGFASGIRPGTRVKQGEVIGYVGSTGLSTAPHLHYEFHMGGRPVNPNTIKFITGDPVPGRNRDHFRRVVRSQIASMNGRSETVLLADAGKDAGARMGDSD